MKRGMKRFWKKKRPRCGLAGDGDVCDRKLQRSAIASFGALRYRLRRLPCSTPYDSWRVIGGDASDNC